MDVGSDTPWPETARENPYMSPRAVDEKGWRPAAGDLAPLNPWFSIWTRPRATIRQIVDKDATQHVLLLAALSGFIETLDRAAMRNAGDVLSLGAIFALAVIGGPIAGIVSLYVGGWVLRWTGAQLGGVGTAEQVRAAIAWGGVPALMAGILWVPQLGLLGGEMFTSNTPRLEGSGGLMAILLATSFVELVAGVWSFVVLLKCLGEVHQFSAWRALGSLLLVGLALLVFIALVVVAALASRVLS